MKNDRPRADRQGGMLSVRRGEAASFEEDEELEECTEMGGEREYRARFRGGVVAEEEGD